MARSSTMPAEDGWEPTLAAALLGAERAPAAAPDVLTDLVAGSDAGSALLARLAAYGALHRAGAGLAPEALVPIAPRDAVGPECPPAAAARLRDLLGSEVRPARLEEWCALAAAAGVRAPAALLPGLGPHRARLGGAIDRIAGPELAWLARAYGAAPAETQEEAADWREGTPSARRDAFADLRARDPEAARAALEPGFRKEKADVREALVEALAVGLSVADEPFLEACLDDRASGVRLAAQRLLPRLGHSHYAARMAARARAALAVASKRCLLGGTTHSLVVTLPEESPDLARDGVEPNRWETLNGGPRAVLLRTILAQAPLSAFAEHPPALWITLALTSAWSEAVFHGLQGAIRRARDPAWTHGMADVLTEAYAERIKGVRRTNELLDLWAQALDLLPEAAWEHRVTALIEARRIEVVLAMLARGPERFSQPFSAVLLDWLALVSRGSESLRQTLAKGWIVERLGERLWPDAETAAQAAAILARLREGEGEGVREGEGGRLRNQLTTLAETLALRAAMRADFEPSTTTGETTAG